MFKEPCKNLIYVLCLAFFYVTNNKEVDEKTQNSLVDASSLTRIWARKWIISWYENNGITTLKKPVNANHVMIAKKKFDNKLCEESIGKTTK